MIQAITKTYDFIHKLELLIVFYNKVFSISSCTIIFIKMNLMRQVMKEECILLILILQKIKLVM